MIEERAGEKRRNRKRRSAGKALGCERPAIEGFRRDRCIELRQGLVSEVMQDLLVGTGESELVELCGC
jgi:hypothetical protein